MRILIVDDELSLLQQLQQVLQKERYTVETAADTNTGEFMVRGLAEGDYNVHFEPSEAYRDTILSGISVMAGQVTRLDTVKLRTAE